MFAEYGAEAGREAGKEDAKAGRSPRPKPSLSFGIVSPGYTNAYLENYHQAYDDQRRIDREIRWRKHVLEEMDTRRAELANAKKHSRDQQSEREK